MNVPIDELITISDIKDFSRRAKELEKAQVDPLACLVELDATTSGRLYDRFYIATPCASFAVKAAAAAACFIPEDMKFRLFVRQAWAVAKNRLRAPFPISSVRPYQAGTLEERLKYFREAYLNHDFDSAFGAVAGFLAADSDRDFFRERSLDLALGDAAHLGFKALFLKLAWNLAERGEWRRTLDCLFPAFHFMVLADHERLDYGGANIHAGQKDAPVTLQTYEQAETAFLRRSPEQASNAVEAMATSGASVRQIYDALLIACAKAVINSNSSSWALPVRVFHLISLCEELDSRNTQPLGHVRAAATLLNKAARASAETYDNRPVDDVVARLCPTDPIGVLKSVVSHSDPHASATAILAGLGMAEEKREELLRTLCALAIKNDAECSCSQDVFYVGQAIHRWRSCQWPNRDVLPASAAYLIGRMSKNYQLAAEYGV